MKASAALYSSHTADMSLDPFVCDALTGPKSDAEVLALEQATSQRDLAFLLSNEVPEAFAEILAALKQAMFLLSAPTLSFPIGDAASTPFKFGKKRSSHVRAQTVAFDASSGTGPSSPGIDVPNRSPQAHHERTASTLASSVVSSKPSLRGSIYMQGFSITKADLVAVLPRSNRSRRDIPLSIVASRPYILEQVQDAYNFVCLAFRTLQESTETENDEVDDDGTAGESVVRKVHRALDIQSVNELLEMVTEAVTCARDLITLTPPQLVFPQTDCPPNITMPVLPPHVVLEMSVHGTQLVVRAYGLVPCGHQHDNAKAQDVVSAAAKARLSIDEGSSPLAAGRGNGARGGGGGGKDKKGTPDRTSDANLTLSAASHSTAGVPGTAPSPGARGSHAHHSHGSDAHSQNHQSVLEGREFFFRDQWLRVSDRVEHAYPIPSFNDALASMDRALEISTLLSRKTSVYYRLA